MFAVSFGCVGACANWAPLYIHSAKKPDAENGTKKDAKRKRESSITSDAEKTPPPSPEEEDDDGVQVTKIYSVSRCCKDWLIILGVSNPACPNTLLFWIWVVIC